MNEREKKKYEQELLAKHSTGFGLLSGRIGLTSSPDFQSSSLMGVNDLAHYLSQKGGLTQQERMIRDKRRSLDKAVLYSYQGAFVKKYYPENMELMDGVREQPPARALINPNKLKPDYDDKIISIGFEHEFTPGDVFEWVGTNTHWLIYLQDLTELAYFRGDIRKCSYKISWVDEDGNKQDTFIALKGPTETRIKSLSTHGSSIDVPNYGISFMMPNTDNNLKYFKRYSKFYLSGSTGENICWRVEAIDWLSTPGIIEISAVEYYSNEFEDDVENGVVGGLIVEKEDPNPGNINDFIVGETFIKPKMKYTYTYRGTLQSEWRVDGNAPVTLKQNGKTVELQWNTTYSGQFDLYYGSQCRTIIVESLF